jgi:hypothetical protein
MMSSGISSKACDTLAICSATLRIIVSRIGRVIAANSIDTAHRKSLIGADDRKPHKIKKACKSIN